MGIHYKKPLLVITMLLSGILFSQQKLSKKIEETYEITNAGKFHIENKYGDVIINGWDKNNIAITMEVQVSHRKMKNARNLLDRIQQNIRKANEFISVTSEISEKNTSFFSRYFNKINPLDLDKSNVDINYTIYLPANIDIDITNKFGDVIITGWTGKLDANVQHGDLWLNENVKDADIEMRFGKLQTKSITIAKLKLKNGVVDMEEVTDLRINSSGTTIDIDHVSVLELYSSKDKINIVNIGSIAGDLEFSYAHLETVEQDIKLSMKWGDFWISKITKPNAMIHIDQELSDITINISGLNFDFDANLEEGTLKIPKSFINIETNIINKTRDIRYIKASYGKGAKTGTFSITGIKGQIILRE